MCGTRNSTTHHVCLIYQAALRLTIEYIRFRVPALVEDLTELIKHPYLLTGGYLR